MPRYVILRHDHPALHWDLMLEAGDRLRTWRLAELPHPGVVVAAEPIGDHRRLYLDYEGPVSGGRGTVERWDAGTFAGDANAPERVTVSVDGRRLRGVLTLARTESGGWECRFDQ